MLELVRYSSEHKEQWDSFVSFSRNGTFLFYRDFMDYHSDRYQDCSFIVFKKSNILCVIPGNIENLAYLTHGGLTYGGLITSPKMIASEVIEVFTLMNAFLVKLGLIEVIYKPIPWIYHRIPAQEDIYALFLNNAEKIGCNISSTIIQVTKLRFSKLRRRGVRKGIKEGCQIIESESYTEFWNILEENLKTSYHTKPVHSLDEIEFLHDKFKDNIKLFVVVVKDKIVGGTVLFLMDNIVHVQYISANQLGKNVGALDILFDYLVNEKFVHIPIFNFGHSTEQMGQHLNKNLIFQKEGFGGRGVVYETYKYEL